MYRILRNDSGSHIIPLFLLDQDNLRRSKPVQVKNEKIHVVYKFSHRVIKTCYLLPEEVVSALLTGLLRSLLEKDEQALG